MKEITVLSGKGGTGKTTITAALASLAGNAVYCDNDVDAADLHLIFKPRVQEAFRFSSGWKVEILHDTCTLCKQCMATCRFDAIHLEGDDLWINPFQCEGCRLCERICPEAAIASTQNYHTKWYVSGSRFGKLIHAEMGPGEENSGKLVTQIRKKAKDIARASASPYLISDGPPGIGCATIATLSGTDQVLLVLEPTKTGLHDAIRLLELIQSFHIKAAAVINKYDINTELCREVESCLGKHHIPLLARIPFHEHMVEAMTLGKTIVEYQPTSELAELLEQVWRKLQDETVL